MSSLADRLLIQEAWNDPVRAPSARYSDWRTVPLPRSLRTDTPPAGWVAIFYQPNGSVLGWTPIDTAKKWVLRLVKAGWDRDAGSCTIGRRAGQTFQTAVFARIRRLDAVDVADNPNDVIIKEMAEELADSRRGGQTGRYHGLDIGHIHTMNEELFNGVPGLRQVLAAHYRQAHMLEESTYLKVMELLRQPPVRRVGPSLPE